jgi:hypothetical protein
MFRNCLVEAASSRPVPDVASCLAGLLTCHQPAYRTCYLHCSVHGFPNKVSPYHTVYVSTLWFHLRHSFIKSATTVNPQAFHFLHVPLLTWAKWVLNFQWKLKRSLIKRELSVHALKSHMALATWFVSWPLVKKDLNSMGFRATLCCISQMGLVLCGEDNYQACRGGPGG